MSFALFLAGLYVADHFVLVAFFFTASVEVHCGKPKLPNAFGLYLLGLECGFSRFFYELHWTHE